MLKRLALALAAVAAVTTPAFADLCVKMPYPPRSLQQEPNVAYTIRETGDPSTKCKGGGLSCAGRCSTGQWVIWIDKDFTASEKRCAILHEKAHLPPNLWRPGHRGTWDETPPMGGWQPACA